MTNQWAWAPHEDGPWDTVFPTREEAEEFGRTDGAEEWDITEAPFGYVAKIEEIIPANYARRAADAEAMVETMDEQGDLGCAFDEPVFTTLPGAQDALETALAEWAKGYVTCEGKCLVGVCLGVQPGSAE